ncbi:hypothetical protein [Microbacterium sp. RU33B]|uniref:hypothetical protein n=1 Tax=Microbacterium sp. RU33B TaxID=1907390 RepID=UPI000965F322|nr:hypothetical protein [Microbacterium sp. RU33B]SIT66507.1 hypothetical protein SAMN05880545_0003 [Microbacterium sp. RU33B]
MLTRTPALIGTALALMLALGSAGAASAAQSTSLTASPENIAVGDISTVTATDLGGLETAVFGLDGTPGGSLKVIGASGSASSAEVPVTSGTASVDFSSTESGTFTISVGNGETVLSTTTITVTAGSGGDAPTATVEASPASVSVGDSSTITVTGLGDLATADFGLDGTPGGSLSAESARVADGTASVEFTATEPGTFTIAVSDGETVLGTTTVTVSAAGPSPTASVTPVTPAQDSSNGLIWTVVVLSVLVVGAIVTIIILARHRRSAAA